MATLTDLQFLQMEAPELSGAPLLKNGMTFATATDFFQAMLDTNGGVKELALAQIFRLLSSEDRNASLQLGEFGYSRRTGMTFDQAREYWEGRYRASLISNATFAPTVPSVRNSLLYWPQPPVVR